MADIYHQFLIHAPAHRVFEAVTTPVGLDAWWTKQSQGEPIEGSEYQLGFGPDYDWRAAVTKSVRDSEFELQLTQADQDWLKTRVGFQIAQEGETTHVRFHHLGWPEENEHYRISCYCWAMYLRLLKRYAEHGETVPYEDRLEV